MMRSLYSGISGLRNHQTRMDVIGNNVSNVNTAGFKASRTIFQDIFSQTLSAGMSNTGESGGTNPVQIGLGIRLSTIDVMHTSAPFGRTDNPFDMMIENEGFFIVEDAGGGQLFTRVGNFGLDDQGYLVTSEGMFVMGFVGDLAFVPARPGMTYEVEDPSALRALLNNALRANGEPLFPDPNNPLHWIVGTPMPADPSIHTEISTAADLVTALNAALVAGGDPPFPNPAVAGHWQPARPATAEAAPVATWDMDNLQRIRLRVPEPGNPETFVDLLGFNVSEDGTISVVIDNLRVDIARVGLALFSNVNGLERAGNSLWRQTASSGEAVVTRARDEGAANSTINGGGLEMSNVDLASEFTDMIVTQRGYQANSRIITVSDSLLEELVNLKR